MSDAGFRRSTGARVGILALNLLCPGLGLIRVGRWQVALAWIVAPIAVLLILTALAAATSVPSFGAMVAVTILLLLFAIAWPIAAMIWTWRLSPVRTGRAPWWARWYSLVAIVLATHIVLDPCLTALQSMYKGYAISSESMAPTLVKHDRVLADLRWRTPAIGDIVIFHGPDSVRIARVAALGGQTIALQNGVPIVDGRRAVQKGAGRFSFEGYEGMATGARLVEQLPGERGSHSIVDLEPGQFDNTDPVHVPPGYLFVLGDNRDRAADSRVPRELEGAGLVPLSAVIGRPLYIHWSSDRSRIGRPVSH